MLIFLTNNWENHFKGNPMNKDNNKTMDHIINLFAPNITIDDCLSNSLKEQDTVFTAKSPNADHIIIFHHITNLGGTRTTPNTKTFVLVGMESVAFPAQVSMEYFFVSVDHAVPAWNVFTAITGPEQATNLNPCANAVEKSFRPCMPIPPFLATMLIDQGGTFIPDLIFVAVTKIATFSTKHEDDNAFTSADTHARAIVNWLWTSMKAEFPSINAAPSI